MEFRLHGGGRFRRWLGGQFGGDLALGDRVLRRILHVSGAAVLLYFVIPSGFFVVASTEEILLGLLAAVLVIEVLRLAYGLELATVREYETRRIGGYVYYSVALTAAVLLFPEPIAAAVVLGTALVDPLMGEIREHPRRAGSTRRCRSRSTRGLRSSPSRGIGRWPVATSALLAVAAAAVAVAAERPRLNWVDDDLVMTIVPALLLAGLGIVVLGLPR